MELSFLLPVYAVGTNVVHILSICAISRLRSVDCADLHLLIFTIYRLCNNVSIVVQSVDNFIYLWYSR